MSRRPPAARRRTTRRRTPPSSQGLVESNHAGFTGTGFVNYNNVVGSYVEWTVTAATPGNVGFEIRYANGTTANRPMDISVNGDRGRRRPGLPAAPAPGPPGRR